MRVTTVEDIGNIIREHRSHKQWTQAQLARQAGVSREWVSRVENGQNPDVEAASALRTLGALGLILTVNPNPGAIHGPRPR